MKLCWDKIEGLRYNKKTDKWYSKSQMFEYKEPLLSADIDNCITLCYDCHKKVHQKDGCKYPQLKLEEC